MEQKAFFFSKDNQFETLPFVITEGEALVTGCCN
jgi:hypothetical protein